jgi:hypothetical protein
MHIQIEDIAHLKECKKLTYLLDRWEDTIRQSLYGSLAAEVNQPPIVLNLEDMMGHWGSADKLLEVLVKALERMEIGDGHNIIAAMTDNPTMIKAFQPKFQEKFYWVLIRSFPPLVKVFQWNDESRPSHAFSMASIQSSEKFVHTHLWSSMWQKLLR